jgi:hypothetical protein
MTQNGALYALRYGATWDAFEIRAVRNLCPIHECKENENNK